MDRQISICGDPEVNAHRMPRRPVWRRVFSWERGLLCMAVLAIAVATNPDDNHFLKFVEEYTQRGLGVLPGQRCANS